MTTTKTYCKYCGRELKTWRDPEPTDERICTDCEATRDAARRDEADHAD